MKKLKDFGFQELNQKEQRSINGGNWEVWFVVSTAVYWVGSQVAGYLDLDDGYTPCDEGCGS